MSTAPARPTETAETREALRAVRDRIVSPIYGGIDDTFWMSPTQTVVDFIDAALQDGGWQPPPVPGRHAVEALDFFERYASRLVPADYATGYREACQHVIGRAGMPQELPERARHVKGGTEYEVLHRGVELQVSLTRAVGNGDVAIDAAALEEGERVVIYRGSDGKLWAREESEFDDGRFVPASVEEK